MVPPSELMRLAIAHIHPLMAAYDRAATHFPIHPEMILWPIEGDGFLLRLLARELFCFEPGRYPLNAQSLLAQMPPDNEIHVFRDSREFLRRQLHAHVEGYGMVSCASPSSILCSSGAGGSTTTVR